MPLLDHFHPPLSTRRHWEGFHARWASALADRLNDDLLPANLFAEPQIHVLETYAVRIINTDSGPTLVTAIELVSPRNKDRPDARRSFAAKCVTYLAHGIGLILVDIVTNRSANLHNETMQFWQGGGQSLLPSDASLYATAYRAARRDDKDEIDIWSAKLTVGSSLPTLPLAVAPDQAVPVDLESTYAEACLKLRLENADPL